MCVKKNAITRAITKWCLMGDKEENENLLQPAFLLSVLFTPLSQGGKQLPKLLRAPELIST